MDPYTIGTIHTLVLLYMLWYIFTRVMALVAIGFLLSEVGFNWKIGVLAIITFVPFLGDFFILIGALGLVLSIVA